MANYSINQVRQLYVAKGYKANVAETDAVGTIGGVKGINNDGIKKEVYFQYRGVDGLLHSDIIQVEGLTSVRVIKAADQVIPMKKVKVSLKSSVNGGAPISGESYVLGINFKNFFSSGDDSEYYKNAAVLGQSNMTAAQFYAAMKDALNLAFSREAGATKTSNPYLEFTADANGLYIKEKPQEWALGTKKQRRIRFDVFPGTVYNGGVDVQWGEVADQTPTKAAAAAGTKDVDFIGNGKQIADLEWFCMGERGDQYRNVGWPHVIPTTYLVDSEKQYNLLEIHYGFADSGIHNYRTEKEITVVAEEASILNSLIGAINTAAGTSIPTIATSAGGNG